MCGVGSIVRRKTRLQESTSMEIILSITKLPPAWTLLLPNTSIQIPLAYLEYYESRSLHLSLKALPTAVWCLERTESPLDRSKTFSSSFGLHFMTKSLYHPLAFELEVADSLDSLEYSGHSVPFPWTLPNLPPGIR